MPRLESDQPISIQLVFPHQIYEAHLHAAKHTRFILIEDDLFFRHYRFHKQKLILHRASLTHLRDQLLDCGYSVDYIDTSAHKTSMQSLKELFQSLNIAEVTYFDPVDDWLEQRVTKVLTTCKLSSRRLHAPNFLTTRGQIDEYFASNPNRMQSFYIWQRKRLKILLDGDKPVGGKWSYDQSNRKKLPKNIQLPTSYKDRSSTYARDAAGWVEKTFADNPGSSETFRYPVTHASAQRWLDDFIENRLACFGPYEDAMSSTEAEVFHSLLSPLLNCGLLTPAQVIKAALGRYASHDIPLESVEGFIRQVIGWREYMRATYLCYGGTMRTKNHLRFSNKIPQSWWNGTVGLTPVDTVIGRVLETGYAHHIERLMILGNSMVLLRFDPEQVYEWFMSLFIDSYDWVMVPNVYAMSQYAAGDLITTKPYISGSNYILKMSDYKKGDWSETWDSLYWQFVNDHRKLLAANYRSAMTVKLYDKLSDDMKKRHEKRASSWLT